MSIRNKKNRMLWVVRVAVTLAILIAPIAVRADGITAPGSNRIGGAAFGGIHSGGGSSVPGWVLSGASIDLDFANGLYFGCATPPTDCLSITRASSKTDLLPSSASGFAYTTFSNNVLAITSTLGLLIEEARTNQLLNSTVPATQTSGSLANGTYTLWVNGSGSAQMSLGTGVGCGVGTATNGTPVTFTISTPGTCIVTVTGSLNAFQLELGAFGTSLIVTAGATATRAADNVALIGQALSTVKALNGSARVSATLAIVSNVFDSLILSATSSTLQSAAHVTNGNAALVQSGVGTFLSVSRAFNNRLRDSLSYSWQQSSYAASLSGAAVVTSSNAFVLVSGSAYTLGGGAANVTNGYIDRLSLWNSVISNAQLQSMP